TDTFDDIVRFKERFQLRTFDDLYSTTSRMCGGQEGFRIDGQTNNGYAGYSIAHGDVDGDGIQDLVIGARGEKATYVIFGSTLDFSNPLLLNGTAIDGTRGFKIYS